VTWPPAHAPLGGDAVDVVGFGEPMVLLQPRAGDTLEHAATLEVHVAGAELNACAAVAALGGRTILVTRLGADPFAARVRTEAARLGVQIVAREDAGRPTGVLFKDARPDGARRVIYYRAGSAATAMDCTDADPGLALCPRAVVVSGLTVALGDGPAEMVRTVGAAASSHGSALVVDVNLRPALGRTDDVLAVLRELLPLTDLLVVGTDEAQLLLGTDAPADVVRAALDAGCREVVVKAGADGCWWVDDAHQPRHLSTVARKVVDPVGAGDAFTGGYIAGRLAGAPPSVAAHVASELAARVVASTGDTAGLPNGTEGQALLASHLTSGARRG
jgi:2-dehydro-3-deoxygluconokinase